MCEPISTGILSGLNVFSGLNSGLQQERAAREAAKQSAEMAANDAALKRQQAQNEIAKGVEERSRHMRAGLLAQGEARNDLAAGGFALDSGSNLSLLADSAEEIQHGASRINQNAAQNAWQYLAGAAGDDNRQIQYQNQAARASDGRLGLLLDTASKTANSLAEINKGLRPKDKT